MALVHLLYASTAAHELTDPELERILESSVQHNRVQGVSGMLLYLQGSWLNILEGDELDVDETFARICADHRHRDVILIARETIAEREFPTWSMRRLEHSDIEEQVANASVFTKIFETLQQGGQSALAVSLLKQFYMV